MNRILVLFLYVHCSILKSLFTFSDGDVENQADWKGYFNVASYAPYFNVDTDVVVDRLISSIYPMDGFYRKIDANPDM